MTFILLRQMEYEGKPRNADPNQNRKTVVSRTVFGDLPTLNLTAVLQELGDLSEIEGLYPRWIALAQVESSTVP